MLPKSRFKLMNFYPPMIGAGIRVKQISSDFTSIEVEMKLRWWNKNVVGTQFGGSLYMMCDPFFMAILMTNLGRDYIVWDKAARIDFLKPGRGHVRALFHIPKTEIARIKALADTERKVEPEFEVDVIDDNDVVVARVHKTLYVRKKG
jgi:acyl-coenzyme A thioesterase PaaI-like protein